MWWDFENVGDYNVFSWSQGITFKDLIVFGLHRHLGVWEGMYGKVTSCFCVAVVLIFENLIIMAMWFALEMATMTNYFGLGQQKHI